MDWQQWRAQAEDIESGGLTVATYDLGDADGRPLTFLHGFPSSSLDLEPVLDRLTGSWRALTLDFPGFGASAKPAGHEYTIVACADAVEALWRARAVTSTVLVAHDYGVSVAQELLARRADGVLATEVEAVVWMNGGLYPDLHRPTDGQLMLLDPEHGAELAAAVDQALFASGVQVTWGDGVPFDERAVAEMWRSMDEGGGVARMHDLLAYIAERRRHADRWRASLEAGAVPSTFVWGDRDPVSGAHMIERVEQTVPNARIVRLADAGHWPTLEAPDEVAAAIDELRTD